MYQTRMVGACMFGYIAGNPTDDAGEREHWDGGEPEDNSFVRDWDWVEDELMKAYQQGLKDAQGL